MQDYSKELESLLGNSLEGGDEEDTQIKDIEPLLPIVFEEKTSKNVDTIPNEDLKDDYKFARSNLYALIGRSNAAIELVLKVANMTDGAAKSLDTLTNLINSSNSLTKDLINLHKAMEKKEATKPKDKSKNVQNNFYLREKEEIQEVGNILDQIEDEDEGKG